MRIYFVVTDPDWRVQRAQRFFRRKQRHGRIIHAGKYTGEVIPADGQNEVISAENLGAQRRRSARMHRVADAVAPHRVDAVDDAALDDEQGQAAAVRASLGGEPAQAVINRSFAGSGGVGRSRRRPLGACLAHRNSSFGSIFTVSYSSARTIR